MVEVTTSKELYDGKPRRNVDLPELSPLDGSPVAFGGVVAPGQVGRETDATGKVEGKLSIPLPPGAPVPELVMAISGSITPAVSGPIPVQEGVRLTGEGGLEGGPVSANELIGYFVPGGADPVIVGTIRVVQNDPAGEPPGTIGPFVMMPAR